MKVVSDAPSPVRVAATMVAVIVVIAMIAVRTIPNGSEGTYQQHQSFQFLTGRRRLLHRHYFPLGLECHLFMKDVEYEATSDNPEGYSIDEWGCELSEEDSSRLGVEHPYFVDIENSTSIVPDGTIPGQSTLFATEATIDLAKTTLYIPDEATVSIQKRSVITIRSRKLADKQGILNALVIRVTDKKGVSPDADLEQLRNDIFKDASSLKTQFEACSYGKLRVSPFTGITETKLKISRGLVDISVDYDVRGKDRTGGNRLDLQRAAFQAATETIGDLRSQFDIVMFCMPPGTGVWLAYAFVNDQFSFYNNKWCSYVSGQLHEVGHNLGLAHSGEGEASYLDKQGIMGLSYGKDDQHFCYNPAKSYQLGWYDDKVKSIDPLSRDPIDGIGNSGIGMFTMKGVADYGNNDAALIVLRLEQTSSEKDYYIGYNRKAGINIDTVEDGDMVTIVRKESGLPDEFGKSMKVASLSLGDSHIIESFNGKRWRDVKISFIGLRHGNATIEVSDVREAKGTIGNQDLPCATHRIEVRTDSYPQQKKWYVVEDGGIGRVYGASPIYTERKTWYETKICLPYNTNYQFVVKDERKNGEGDFFFSCYDQQDNLIFSGGSDSELQLNGVAEKSFIVLKDPSAHQSPINKPHKIVPKKPGFRMRMRMRRNYKRWKARSPSKHPSFVQRDIPKQYSNKEQGKRPKSSTANPTKSSKKHPSSSPSRIPTRNPAVNPINEGVEVFQEVRTQERTQNPSMRPTTSSLPSVSVFPTTSLPSVSVFPTLGPTVTSNPSSPKEPTEEPTEEPTGAPMAEPSAQPAVTVNRVSVVRVARCEDYEQDAFTWSKKYPKTTCLQIYDNYLCDTIWFETNKPLWYICQRSCNRCGAKIPDKDNPFLDNDKNSSKKKSKEEKPTPAPTKQPKSRRDLINKGDEPLSS